MKTINILLLLCFISTLAPAQTIKKGVKWTFIAHKTSADTYELIFEAQLDKSWHIYSQHIADGGPLKTSFNFTPSPSYTLQGKVLELSIPKKIKEPVFNNMELIYFENKAFFKQVVKIQPGTTVINGTIKYMRCSDKQCFPAETDRFSFNLSP